MSVRCNVVMRTFRNLPLYAAVALLAACRGKHPQTTFHPVTEYGRKLNALFENTFIWTMIVLAVVWIVLLIIIVRFREKAGAPRPKPVHGSTKLEIAWTIGPALIVGFIAIPTIRGIFETQAKAPPNALVVEVIGHQWWWEFRYPEYGIVTANELHLPTGRPVDLVMWSADVVHSFWIPRLGGKRDVNPQPVRTAARMKEWGPKVNHIVFTPEQPGDYPGQCAEFCGDSHAIMRVRGEVHTPEDFNVWIASMKTPVEPPAGSLAAQGKQIFTTHMCVACHTVVGTTAMGQLGPNLTGVGTRKYVGAGALPLTQGNLAKWITHPAGVKPGAKMPGTHEPGAGMPATGLTEQEVQAVAAYLASLK
jgi:cytochrome c oxidase subunit 2